MRRNDYSALGGSTFDLLLLSGGLYGSRAAAVSSELTTVEHVQSITTATVESTYETNAARSFSGGTPTVKGTAYSPEVVNARSAEFYKLYGGDPELRTLTNVEARTQYLARDAEIPTLLNQEASLESQAMQAVDLRNANRTAARDAMSDRITADRLAREEPNKTFQELVDLNKSRGLSKDQVYQSIIDSSQRTRTSVNQMLLGDLENTPLQNLGKPNGFDTLYQRAPAAKMEIDALADQIAAKFEGTVIKAPIKSEARAIEKILNDYRGDSTLINDLARNTIVVPEHQIAAVAAELERMGAKVKVINGQADPMGYSGVNSTIKTNAGISGEIQVNSPQMIFAKEKEALARTMLGNDTYQTIADRVGVPGGLGRQYYEQWRVLNRTSVEAERIAAESRNYYNQVRRFENATISVGGASKVVTGETQFIPDYIATSTGDIGSTTGLGPRKLTALQRELQVAEITGGRSAQTFRIGANGNLIIEDTLIYRDGQVVSGVDVFGKNGELIQVGGPGKNANDIVFERTKNALEVLKSEVITREITAQVYYEAGNSERFNNLILESQRILGKKNVFILPKKN